LIVTQACSNARLFHSINYPVHDTIVATDQHVSLNVNDINS